MGTKTVLVYVCLTFGSLVFSVPLAVVNFKRFMEEQDVENACTFPHVLALDEEKLKPCLDTESTGSVVQICEGIVQISKDVCSLGQDSLIPVIDSLNSTTIGNLCVEIEQRHVIANNDSCSDVCSEKTAFYPCKLFVMMVRALFNKFSDTESFQDIHHYIHTLKNYFPFPPHGLMDKGSFLYACGENNQTTSTQNLCMAIKKLAIRHGKGNTAPEIFSKMLANVTGDWDPCPGMEKKGYMNGSNCGSICKGATYTKICRSIVFGDIHLQRLEANATCTDSDLGNESSGTNTTTKSTGETQTASTDTTKNPNVDTEADATRNDSDRGNESSGTNTTSKSTGETQTASTDTTTNFNVDTEANATGNGSDRGNESSGTNTTSKSTGETQTASTDTTKNPNVDTEADATRNDSDRGNESSGTNTTSKSTGETQTASTDTTTNFNVDTEANATGNGSDRGNESSGTNTTSKSTGETQTASTDTTKNPNVDTEANATRNDSDRGNESSGTNTTSKSTGETQTASTDTTKNSNVDTETNTTGTDTKPDTASDDNKTANESPDDEKVGKGGMSYVVYMLLLLVLILGGVIVYIKKEMICEMLKVINPFGSREQHTNKGYRRLKTDDTFSSLEKTE